MDNRPPGSSARGIPQARILKWDAFLTPGDLSDPGIKLMSLVSPVLAGGFFTTSATRYTNTQKQTCIHVNSLLKQRQ